MSCGQRNSSADLYTNSVATSNRWLAHDVSFVPLKVIVYLILSPSVIVYLIFSPFPAALFSMLLDPPTHTGQTKHVKLTKTTNLTLIQLQCTCSTAAPNHNIHTSYQFGFEWHRTAKAKGGKGIVES